MRIGGLTPSTHKRTHLDDTPEIYSHQRTIIIGYCTKSGKQIQIGPVSERGTGSFQSERSTVYGNGVLPPAHVLINLTTTDAYGTLTF